MSTKKDPKTAPPTTRPKREPSAAGKVVAVLIVAVIGLGVLRGYRTHRLEAAAQESGYEWRHELSISK